MTSAITWPVPAADPVEITGAGMQLLRNVDLVKRKLNPTLEVSTIVCVMYDARTKLADQVDIPILLIHGEDDTVVPYEQSQIMATALKKAGKPVEK